MAVRLRCSKYIYISSDTASDFEKPAYQRMVYIYRHIDINIHRFAKNRKQK